MNIHTYHIHISGLVQGVGFRPFVNRIAATFGICGEVCNSTDGVHITFNATETMAVAFYNDLIRKAPVRAVIHKQRLQRVADRHFDGFAIIPSASGAGIQVLITPDVALCPACRRELNDPHNRRHRYAFITCPDCGPRYSILTALPFDREHTTMDYLQPCDACYEEYKGLQNRRHYSQTNSCPACPIHVHLHSLYNGAVIREPAIILQVVREQLAEGKIVAVKGTGGYLLLCDATNARAVQLLRDRKHRPQKPFAVLFASVEMAKTTVQLRKEEVEALESAAAPIVLARLQDTITSGLCCEKVAPGLHILGVMLPGTPLLQLIAQEAGYPLVATSANKSGSPIIYKDEEALTGLQGIADLILIYDRDIVVPQDDSVIRFTGSGQKIIIRRSRGYAPGYFPVPFEMPGSAVLAMGGELKATFAILAADQLYISQYLGDQGAWESQQAYEATLNHLSKLLHFTPRCILVDQHPNYQVSALGRQLGTQTTARVVEVQHHKAHFGAVLAENNLLQTAGTILGIIWDGAGYGEDGQVWGGEVFLMEENQIRRVAHLDYFQQLLGDKMSREPRLSALALLHDQPQWRPQLEQYFTAGEWWYYCQLLQNNAPVNTSSMGRLLDGISALLGITAINTYEGEAAMKLEALADTAAGSPNDYYRIPVKGQLLEWQYLLQGVMEDLDRQLPANYIARKVFCSLAKLIISLAIQYGVNKVACSGGVFQSALLTDMIIALNGEERTFYFHQQLSPNDECIGFGQIACFYLGLIQQAREREKEIPINY
ncbi:carbamoyltransferase HypF [Niastella koreensis]|uniref:Carbamoyltransferase n=3 Tax=Niastella koreensis TaxID=354356 RepID=G8TLP7_NIAKG|nr:carbamoyltransferase HypF [Niastella koreensis]AEV97639.1 (NiFe) hydrogenase maturation protein HypF [Niastella koreensis GR20-10]OQP40536.1 carbamoyltransferase HypF [Niastella koreensis]